MNRIIKYIAAGTVCFSISSQAIASTAIDCLNHNEATDVMVALAPGLMRQGMSECSKFLPANATLMEKGPAALNRYEASAENVSNSAGNAIRKFAGDFVPESLPPSAIVAFAGAMLVDRTAGKLDEESCLGLNNVWAPLAEFPSENLVAAFVAVGGIVSQEEDEKEDKKYPDKSKKPLAGLKMWPHTATS